MGGLDVAAMLAEFGEVGLGDARLNERLMRIAAQIASSPGKSFPDQMETEADQEALYRFLANDKVSLEKILAGHQRETHGRIAGRDCIRVLHDTSEFAFEGERAGLGILKGNMRGFLAHVALAVSADEEREPLGVVGVHPFVNADVLKHRGLTTSQRVRASFVKKRDDKKSSRWEKLALATSAALPEGTRAIHIMDQEADDYVIFETLSNASLGFVIRGSADRLLQGRRRIREVLAEQVVHTFRDVTLNPRSKKKATKQHPQRTARLATLKVCWSEVTLIRPPHNTAPTLQITLNVVHVFEPEPPAGATPIEWTLFTSEPVSTLEDAIAVVDHYRARWMIEEYFKALKTGCAFEKRQLCSLEGLKRAFGLFIPMAWKLLSIRHLGRAPTTQPARASLDDEQLALLRAMLERRARSLPTTPSIRDVMLGIAALGGHIKNNGDPGWIVLGRGFRRFTEAEEGWRLARRSDQS